MPEYYYKDALKAGLREKRECTARGEYPYLPVLEDFVPSERMAIGTDLGLTQIPAEYIVGTRTRGRTNAFARNFMPLLEGNSEFGNKWEALCHAHLNEGIRDPIKVCEYMNRYYVVEGNKRVSVLKFFGAVSVAAQVTRIMPERNEQSEIYYEFVDFYYLSKLNFLEFTKRGSYAQLQQLLGKEPGEYWSEEERKRFNSGYYKFRSALDPAGKLPAGQVGDALLVYIQVYGYPSLFSTDPAGLRQRLEQMREEVELQKEEAPIELKEEPAPGEEKKAGLLSRMLPGGRKKPVKVAFLYDKTLASSGWNMSHELGRRYVERVFEDGIITTAYENVMQEDPQAAMDKAIADGNTVLFTTSPRMLPVSLRTAVEHPELIVMNCSLNTSHRYIRTYYARMYEIKFIAGAVAGVLAQEGMVGYIADYPIYGQIASVNAFALGVQMVNPEARVYLEWSCVDGLENAYRRLTDRGIQIVSSLDMANLPQMESNTVGLSISMEDGERELLAIPVWKWGVYYETLLRRILDKSAQSEYRSSRKALNYYWGLATGVLDLHCSELVPRSVRRLADILKQSIAQKAIHPFAGPIYRQDGSVVGQDGEVLDLTQIANMDYLVDSVEGSIPAYEDLNEVAKATVDMVGIPAALKQSGEERTESGAGV